MSFLQGLRWMKVGHGATGESAVEKGHDLQGREMHSMQLLGKAGAVADPAVAVTGREVTQAAGRWLRRSRHQCE
jgi:hypothetical protein